MNGHRAQVTKFLLLVTFFSLLSTCIGCEAFVRKFTRKPKKENIPKVEMVLAPQEFQAPQLSKEELYRQYYMFWKSWQAELIESLLGSSINKKKQVSCAKEATKNLQQLMPLFDEEKQKILDRYLTQLRTLTESIQDDIYGNSMASQRLSAERIMRNVSRDFSYQKIKDALQ